MTDEAGQTDREIAAPLIAPVVRAVRALGLDVVEPRVLGVGANVAVHLAPAPVVARIATLTAEMRGRADRYLRREREITAALAERDVPVIPTTDLVDPGPHEVDGLAFLLLRHRNLAPVDASSARDARRVARAFVRLSEVLAGLPIEVDVEDRGHPWAEIDVLLDTIASTTSARAVRRIEAVLAMLRESEPDDPWQLVHGDAHRVNVALDGDRLVWFDFEDANLRPPAWDLATLRRSWPAAGEEACRLLAVDPGGFSMRWHHELREVYALLWSELYAQRFVRARRPAAERLTGWMARPVAENLAEEFSG